MTGVANCKRPMGIHNVDLLRYYISNETVPSYTVIQENIILLGTTGCSAPMAHHQLILYYEEIGNTTARIKNHGVS